MTIVHPFNHVVDCAPWRPAAYVGTAAGGFGSIRSRIAYGDRFRAGENTRKDL